MISKTFTNLGYYSYDLICICICIYNWALSTVQLKSFWALRRPAQGIKDRCFSKKAIDRYMFSEMNDYTLPVFELLLHLSTLISKYCTIWHHIHWNLLCISHTLPILVHAQRDRLGFELLMK